MLPCSHFHEMASLSSPSQSLRDQNHLQQTSHAPSKLTGLSSNSTNTIITSHTHTHTQSINFNQWPNPKFIIA